MFGLGPTELIIILVIILVIFGGKRLPDLARSLGEGVREFNQQKKMIQQEYDEVKKEVEPKNGDETLEKAPETKGTKSEPDSEDGTRKEQAQQPGTDQEESGGDSEESDQGEI